MGFLDFFKSGQKQKQLGNDRVPFPAEDQLPIIGEDDIGILNLAIIVGHDAKAQGATFPDLNELSGLMTEYKYNKKVAEYIKVKSESHHINTEIFLRDGDSIKGVYEKVVKHNPDVCIELHFNSHSDPKVSGTETLCSSDSSDVTLSEIIQKNMCAIYARSATSRGVKAIPKSAKGGYAVWSTPNIASCLVEPFFGSNREDANLARYNEEKLADILLQSVKEYAHAKQIVLGRLT